MLRRHPDGIAIDGPSEIAISVVGKGSDGCVVPESDSGVHVSSPQYQSELRWNTIAHTHHAIMRFMTQPDRDDQLVALLRAAEPILRTRIRQRRSARSAHWDTNDAFASRSHAARASSNGRSGFGRLT